MVNSQKLHDHSHTVLIKKPPSIESVNVLVKTKGVNDFAKYEWLQNNLQLITIMQEFSRKIMEYLQCASISK